MRVWSTTITFLSCTGPTALSRRSQARASRLCSSSQIQLHLEPWSTPMLQLAPSHHFEPRALVQTHQFLMRDQSKSFHLLLLSCFPQSPHVLPQEPQSDSSPPDTLGDANAVNSDIPTSSFVCFHRFVRKGTRDRSCRRDETLQLLFGEGAEKKLWRDALTIPATQRNAGLVSVS